MLGTVLAAGDTVVGKHVYVLMELRVNNHGNKGRARMQIPAARHQSPGSP